MAFLSFWKTSALLGIFAFLLHPTMARAGEDFATFVYFTGIGCPHCAAVDPVLLKEKVRQNDLLVIEYEIYRDNENAPLLLAYDKQLQTGLGVPLLIVGTEKSDILIGDTPILKKIDSLKSSKKNNGVILPTGSIAFEKLLLSDLPRKPKLWFKNRAALRKDANSKESGSIKDFLLLGIIPEKCVPSPEKGIALSGDEAIFKQACLYNGWLLFNN